MDYMHTQMDVSAERREPSEATAREMKNAVTGLTGRLDTGKGRMANVKMEQQRLLQMKRRETIK